MNDQANVLAVVPGKSDQQLAEELKAELLEKSKPYLEVLTKASRAGFVIQMGCGPNGFGEIVIQQLTIAKHF